MQEWQQQMQMRVQEQMWCSMDFFHTSLVLGAQVREETNNQYDTTCGHSCTLTFFFAQWHAHLQILLQIGGNIRIYTMLHRATWKVFRHTCILTLTHLCILLTLTHLPCTISYLWIHLHMRAHTHQCINLAHLHANLKI